MPKVTFRAVSHSLHCSLCKHFLELQDVCLSYLEIIQSPTNILDPQSSNHTLCSPCISSCNFAKRSFTFVMLSCPFSISSDFNFFRNFSVSPTTFALFSHVLHSPFLYITCPSYILSFHNLLVIHLFPFLPFPGVPLDTPHCILSNLVRSKMWCNFLCKSKLWKVEY